MRIRARTGAAAALLAVPALLLAQNDPVTRAIDATQQTQRAAAASQQKVDQLDDQTRALLERYRAANWQAQQLTVYAGQLDQLLSSQQAELQSLQRQIVEMDRIEEELLPLMLRMLNSLEQFVKLDLPFLEQERSERLASLRRSLADPEVGGAERFRRILEAYQIENEYGRTLGAERTEVDGRVVDTLRVGRSALFAIGLDGGDAMQWNADTRRWQPLERRYIAQVRQGLKIAREVATAELLVLPMPQVQAQPGAKP